jgi:hypothetical protein
MLLSLPSVYLGVVDEGDVPHAPAEQTPGHVAAKCPGPQQKAFGVGNLETK